MLSSTGAGDVRAPMLVVNVALRQWRFLYDQGITAASIVQIDGTGNADFVKYGTPAQGFLSTTATRLSI